MMSYFLFEGINLNLNQNFEEKNVICIYVQKNQRVTLK